MHNATLRLSPCGLRHIGASTVFLLFMRVHYIIYISTVHALHIHAPAARKRLDNKARAVTAHNIIRRLTVKQLHPILLSEAPIPTR